MASARLEKYQRLRYYRGTVPWSWPPFATVPIARRQVLEILHGNQRTAFLSEVKPEETFLSRDYLRAEVKHKALTPSPWGQWWGGSDISEALFVCMVFCPEPAF